MPPHHAVQSTQVLLLAQHVHMSHRYTSNSPIVSLCVPLLHDPTEHLLTAMHTQRRASAVVSAWQHHAEHARRVGLLTVAYVLNDQARAEADTCGGLCPFSLLGIYIHTQYPQVAVQRAHAHKLGHATAPEQSAGQAAHYCTRRGNHSGGPFNDCLLQRNWPRQPSNRCAK